MTSTQLPGPVLNLNSPPDDVVAMLRDQVDLFAQLRDLSQRQSSVIESGTVDPLLAILSQRQQLIHRLQQIESRLSPIRSRWAEFYRQLPEPKRHEISLLVEQVRRDLGEIMTRDTKDGEKLRSAQRRVGEQLNQVNRAGQAVQAYRPTTPSQSAFTNQQG